MRRAQRKAGAPAPSTAAVSPRGVESSSGRRAGFRRLLALLLGAPGLFAGAPGLVVAAAPTGLVLGLGALGLLAAVPVQAQSAPRNVEVTPGVGRLTITWQQPLNWAGVPLQRRLYVIQWKRSSDPESAFKSLNYVRIPRGSDTSAVFLGNQGAGANQHTVNAATAYDLRIRPASRFEGRGFNRNSWATVRNKTPLPAQRSSSTVAIWSATLTVDQTTVNSRDFFGCDDSDGSHVDCSSALTDNSFDYRGTTYTIKSLFRDQDPSVGSLLVLDLDKAAPTDPLILQLDSAALYITSAQMYNAGSSANARLSWSGLATLPSWTDGQTVSLSLTTIPSLNLLLESAGDGVLSVSWRGLPGATGYDVQYTSADVSTAPDDATAAGTNPSTGWVAAARQASSIDPGQFIGGLTAGREYRVRVRVKNAFSTGAWTVASATVRSRNLSRIPWAATLTAEYTGATGIGCSNCRVALTDNDATDILGSEIVRIELETSDGTLSLHAADAFLSPWDVWNTFTRNRLGTDYPKLCVDGTAFAFTEDRIFEIDSVKRRAVWGSSGLSWSSGDEVGLSIITSGSCPSSYAELIQLIAH